jgi:lysophospholipase L1-like esterase
MAPEDNVVANNHETPPAEVCPRTLVCLGDSITAGQVSADWVSELRRRLGPHWEIVNAGTDGATSGDLLKRLREVNDLRPNFVIVQVGSNDALGASFPWWIRSLAQRRFPPRETAWADELEANVCQVVAGLQCPPRSVAVVSPPPFGERLDTPANEDVRRACAALLRSAEQTGATYLPFGELLASRIAQGHSHVALTLNVRWMLRTFYRVAVRREPPDRLSQRYGYRLLADGLHLNSVAGSLLANLVYDFVTGSISSIQPEPRLLAPAVDVQEHKRRAIPVIEASGPGRNTGRVALRAR